MREKNSVLLKIVKRVGRGFYTGGKKTMVAKEGLEEREI
jgi:hypothetical protein